MKLQDQHLEALTEQRKTIRMVWLISALAPPVILFLLLIFVIPELSGNGTIKFAFYGSLVAVGVPIYLYLNWYHYKKYRSVIADLKQPVLLSSQTTLSKLSHRFDDDSRIDYYIAKFGDGSSCHLKSPVAHKLTTGQEYILTYFKASKAVLEIRSAGNKTLISNQHIIR